MDEIRDAQKTDSISRFVDGHAVRTNPFGENRSGDRAYRRAERIAAAIHLLTNHVPSAEPVVEKLRGGSIELLELLLNVREEMRASQSRNLVALQRVIRRLISLVRMLTVSGSISIQNATTMVEALDELGGFLVASQRSILSENIALTRDDLLDVRGAHVRARPAGHILRDIKDTPGISDKPSITDVTAMGNTLGATKGQLSVRAQSIVEVLRTGGVMGIREVCSNLPEYSEKMIQRELSELVSGGQVKKTGLKRWSKYGIAQ